MSRTLNHTEGRSILACFILPSPTLPQCPAPDPPLTWGELTAIEPALTAVEQAALELHKRTRGLDVVEWWKIKRQFLPLVGYRAQQYKLRNSASYEVAYDHLLHCWETGRRPKR